MVHAAVAKKEEFVLAAQRFVENRGIKTRTMFRHANRPLYRKLLRDGLVEQLVFECERRNLAGMSRREIISYALHLIDNAVARTLPKLRKEDPYLVRVLGQRELLETVIRIARRRGLMERE